MNERIWVRISVLCALILSACSSTVDRGGTGNVGSVSEAVSGTITLTSGSYTSGGYDFSTQTYTGLTGGDFYFYQGAFWANNVGQRGVVNVGPCSSVDSVTTMPITGYSQFNVAATVGNCYVALTHYDERDYIVLHVDSLSGSTISLTWKLVSTGWWGATLSSGSSASAGYDFDTRTYTGNSGGDFYFYQGAFWANNVGQRGLVSVGPCNSVDSVPTVPTSGYTSFSTATAGNCYVSLGHNEEHGNIVFRVESADSITAVLTFKIVDDCYGLTDFRQNVNCWLTKNPTVAQYVIWQQRLALGSSSPTAWSQWTNSQRDDLRTNVVNYESLLANTITQDPDPLVDPPVNQETLQDTDFPVVVLTTNDAWRLYVKTVAMSLAVELSQYVPWTVTTYDAPSLSALFDSRNTVFYTWSGRTGLPNPTPQAEGYMAVENMYDKVNHTTFTPTGSWVTPAPPDETLQFIRAKSLQGSTRLLTIQNTLDWSRRLRHFQNGTGNNVGTFQRVWQYRGPAPVSATIATTVDPGNSADPTDPFHWTAGCQGTAGFLHSVLRTINIPVDSNVVPLNLSHSITRFMTDNVYLSHADDPYYGSDPYGIPASAMLISDTTYQAWFVNATQPVLNEDTARENPETWIQYLSPKLEFDYCSDPPGTTPANSRVFQQFAPWPDIYTLSYLQNLPPDPANPSLPASLWDRLAQKIQNNGGCTATMNAINQQMSDCTAVRPIAESLATCTWN